MGTLIDKHEAVIRFNGGVTVGLERHVGSRTTVRFANTQHMGFHEKGKGEIIMQHLTSRRQYEAALKAKVEHEAAELYYIDGDFHQYVLDTVDVGAASNGFYGAVFAAERCEAVTLFGYLKNWAEAGVKYHYYDDVEPNVSQKARDDSEARKFDEFLWEHRARFRYGEPGATPILDPRSAEYAALHPWPPPPPPLPPAPPPKVSHRALGRHEDGRVVLSTSRSPRLTTRTSRPRPGCGGRRCRRRPRSPTSWRRWWPTCKRSASGKPRRPPTRQRRRRRRARRRQRAGEKPARQGMGAAERRAGGRGGGPSSRRGRSAARGAR